MKQLKAISKSKPQPAVNQLWGDWFIIVLRIISSLLRLLFGGNTDTLLP